MKEQYSLFSYKQGSSFLHKTPSWCKILFIPVISISTLCLPIWFCVALVLIQFALACVLRFSLREQLCDIRPVIYYAFLLYFVKLISILFTLIVPSLNIQNSAEFSWKWFALQFSWESEKESVFMLLKILCLMQTASLLFKTSTSLEIRQGFEKIERFIRNLFYHLFRFSKKNESDGSQNSAPVATALSLFVNFIPMVSSIWAQSKKAWMARGGKKGVKMYLSLLPILFSVGMKKAWNTSRAIQIRSI